MQHVRGRDRESNRGEAASPSCIICDVSQYRRRQWRCCCCCWRHGYISLSPCLSFLYFLPFLLSLYIYIIYTYEIISLCYLPFLSLLPFLYISSLSLSLSLSLECKTYCLVSLHPPKTEVIGDSYLLLTQVLEAPEVQLLYLMKSVLVAVVVVVVIAERKLLQQQQQRLIVDG